MSKKQILQKFTAWVLVCVMTLGIAPVYAFGAEQSAQDAFSRTRDELIEQTLADYWAAEDDDAADDRALRVTGLGALPDISPDIEARVGDIDLTVFDLWADIHPNFEKPPGGTIIEAHYQIQRTINTNDLSWHPIHSDNFILSAYGSPIRFEIPAAQLGDEGFYRVDVGFVIRDAYGESLWVEPGRTVAFRAVLVDPVSFPGFNIFPENFPTRVEIVVEEPEEIMGAFAFTEDAAGESAVIFDIELSTPPGAESFIPSILGWEIIGPCAGILASGSFDELGRSHIYYSIDNVQEHHAGEYVLAVNFAVNGQFSTEFIAAMALTIVPTARDIRFEHVAQFGAPAGQIFAVGTMRESRTLRTQVTIDFDLAQESLGLGHEMGDETNIRMQWYFNSRFGGATMPVGDPLFFTPSQFGIPLTPILPDVGREAMREISLNTESFAPNGLNREEHSGDYTLRVEITTPGQSPLVRTSRPITLSVVGLGDALYYDWLRGNPAATGIVPGSPGYASHPGGWAAIHADTLGFGYDGTLWVIEDHLWQIGLTP
ncbi:MAG: hypothetical protein LBE35_02125 [Clostridiales bacterium]|jgi:hypothetical protein|nr:hypothetical protein [Clostridiales bacterium]